jgi:hypothetical protein
MNLHRLVRGAVNAVNRDVLIPWLSSTGAINDNTTGIATPTYAPVQSIWAQIQPLPTDELAHMDNLNIQGVLRHVYMKGAVASAVRADGTGGDLLQFPEVCNGPQRTWLVMKVMEQWDSWCLVVVRLQNDLNWAWTADSSVTADTSQSSDA